MMDTINSQNTDLSSWITLCVILGHAVCFVFVCVYVCVCVCVCVHYSVKLRGLNPRANYTDRAAAAGRRS
jgi:hypothetical protein